MPKKIGPIESDVYGFNALALLANSSKTFSDEMLALDFQECTTFDANMAAPLYTALTCYHVEKVKAINIRHDIRTILKKNGFLGELGVLNADDPDQTILPFRRFNRNAGASFAIYLSQYMTGRGIPRMSAGLTKRFLQSLFEIFQNAAMHSNSHSGIFVCGQLSPAMHRLDFTIADAGIGIRDNVRRHFNNTINSCSAIKWALEKGHTTRTNNQPGGLGLKLLKDFIRINQGKIQIASRYGFHEISDMAEPFYKLDYDFPGTCVNIEINTDDARNYALKSEIKSSDIF
ncbi:MAG: ATP-binding protein [Chlorobium sp.]|jgi:hypothetical protein|uniref:ATP-binding protein n=1 Tax=Chlorobium sp. TaxID=1095 RepID=UPI001D3E589E|nr:ATP-binding protein [Chlorobium sp.]MBN1279564.1 ATP-binding protein [Chlorobiaceae bacterium]MCF8216905.1 ATP-binding protein [Chlorobium sp.]MCF8271729.1 ATP-binding protein [Chlorobium sp.]MCF8288117.1 ATP-binding protein [Chlorobium sp.]MCF8291708.1 ATP-binding protein [Chlorobium sp.]